MGTFERYLSWWVLLCMGLGLLIGYWLDTDIEIISHLEYANVNLVVAVLVWMMIYPMMVQIDFSALKLLKNNYKGLGLTVLINWLVKPFTMFGFAWVFFHFIFKAYLQPDEAAQYLAGAILLGAAPCTAMVFVWSYLSDGDATYTLVQVSINDLILLIAFVPIVSFLLGVGNIEIPYSTLFVSVLVFVVIPLLTGYFSRVWLIKNKGEEWFKNHFLTRLKPMAMAALLLTLVLLFSFQGTNMLAQPFTILLIAVPLTIQTYFIFFLTWFLGRFIGLRYPVCAPAAMIGASNFFELAVAIAISLFGLNSGASLATVVGVLIEVPVMLSLVKIANKWKYNE